MQKLLLIDAFSMVYRSFYAIQSLTGSDGQPLNAVYGFTKALRRILDAQQPTHVGVIFDQGAPQRRLVAFPSYKANRSPIPPDLKRQLPVIREMLAAFRLMVVEMEGEEADDIIATLAVQSSRSGADVIIVSTDKDFAQLVGPRIRLLRPDGKQIGLVDADTVRKIYGVTPEQMVDYLSLLGDAVDNIPGIAGVGEKTAALLLRQFGSLESLLERISEVSKPAIRCEISAHADRLRQNRALIALYTDLLLPVSWEELQCSKPDMAALHTLFEQLGFKSFITELEKFDNQTPELFSHFRQS